MRITQKVSKKVGFLLFTLFLIPTLIWVGILGYYNKTYQKNCESLLSFTSPRVYLVVETDDSIAPFGVENLEYHIVKEKEIYRAKLDPTKWIILSHSNVPAIQVKALARLLYKEPYNPCNFSKLAVSVTGVPLTGFLVKKDNRLISTSLSLKEYLLWRFLEKTAPIKELKIEASKKITLPTEEEVLAYAYTDFLEALGPLFKNDKIAQEGLFVEIYNASSKPGYATFWSKILRMYGVNVIRVGNASLPDQYNSYDLFIFAEEKANSTVTLRVIKELYKTRNIYWSSKRPPFLLTSADIVIILIR